MSDDHEQNDRPQTPDQGGEGEQKPNQAGEAENIFAEAVNLEGGLPDEIELAETPERMPSGCPNCDAAVPEGAMVCVQCGTHLITGRQLDTQTETPEDETPSPMARVRRWAYLAALGARRWARAVKRFVLIQRERIRLFGLHRRRKVCVSRLGERVLSLRIEDEHLKECYREADMAERQIEETRARIDAIVRGE